MERIEKINIDSVTDRDFSIIEDCRLDDNTTNNIPLNDVDIIVSVYDTTDNFIMQRIIDGSDFEYNFNTEQDMINYIRDDVINLDINELNPGKYRLRFSFINDTFGVVDESNNKFLVTEISSDGTEIRLNPLNNDEYFVNDFSNVRQYKRVEGDINVNESSLISFYRDYIDFVFVEGTINDIFYSSYSNIGTNESFTLLEYLTNVLSEREDINNPENRATELIDSMKLQVLTQKDEVLMQLHQYFENNKSQILDDAHRASENDIQSLVDDYKLDIKNETYDILTDIISDIVDSTLNNFDINDSINGELDTHNERFTIPSSNFKSGSRRGSDNQRRRSNAQLINTDDSGLSNLEPIDDDPGGTTIGGPALT